MIRKTQTNFVIVTMVLLTAVIVFFVASTVFVNYRTSRDETNKQLKNIVYSYGMHGISPGQWQRASAFDCYWQADGSLSVDDFSIDGELFDTVTDAQTFVNSAVVGGVVVNATKCGENLYCARQDNLYYAVYVDDFYVRVAVVDRQLEENILTDTTVNLVILSTAAVVVIFVVVWVLSYSVVKPVACAFDKQRQFISDASHELKTPVTIIRANAEVLQAEGGWSEWTDNILSQTQRLTTLVDEMLTLARLEEQTTVKQNVDLSSTVQNCVLEFEPLAYENNKKFTLNVQDGVQICTNAQHVRRVVSLLVDNAVKYSETFVQVDFVATQRGGKLVVTNDGCQVPSDQADKLLERFYRFDTSRARQTGGSGLGLATVKALCDNNKWKLILECNEGGNMIVCVDMA